MSDVGKTYGTDITVLEGLNLKISQGELVAFVGPSGCGKSTLLRMIAGLEGISKGTIKIDGVEVNQTPPANRGVAMVFQSYALYPHMTVAQNMSFALEIAKRPRTSIDSIVFDVAEKLELSNLLARYPKELSGGQRQRVAIGRAMVRDPKVFLFDEPLSNLDAALRAATRVQISELKKSLPQSTMIYVTHDQTEAMTLADRIVVLANNSIAQVGTPLELYLRPKTEFVGQFIGSPAMNLMTGTISETGKLTKVQFANGEFVFSNIYTSERYIGEKVNVGVRPEDLVLCDSEECLYSGTVSLVEMLGDSTLLHLDSNAPNAGPLVKMHGVQASLMDSRINLTAFPEKVHLFHNGRSLHYT